MSVENISDSNNENLETSSNCLYVNKIEVNTRIIYHIVVIKKMLLPPIRLGKETKAQTEKKNNF